MIRVAALALLIATSAAAQDSPTSPEEPAALPAPDVMRHAVVLIDFTGKGKYLGTPLICPGETEPLPPDDICMSSMYDQPVEIRRRIAGRPSIRGYLLRYKIVEWGFPEGATILAAVVPNPEGRGLFAPWWKEADERGEICLDQREAEYLKIVPQWSRWKSHKPRKSDREVPLMRCVET